LHRTKPKNLALHALQAAGLHFKADDEQEHDDSEFRDLEN
jgi:hypothetical protein